MPYKSQEDKRNASKRWRLKHPEKAKAISQRHNKRWWQKYKDRYKTQTKLDRQEVITNYGGKCVCCGESRWEFLTIDHIGGWNKEVEGEKLMARALYKWLKINGWPKDRYRLLCYNCNIVIGQFGYCPHNQYQRTPLE